MLIKKGRGILTWRIDEAGFRLVSTQTMVSRNSFQFFFFWKYNTNNNRNSSSILFKSSSSKPKKRYVIAGIYLWVLRITVA